MLKPLLVVLALLPLPAAAAPWKLDPATTVTADVGWEGRTVQVRFPTLSGDIDFDQNHPERARASISVAAGDATTGVARGRQPAPQPRLPRRRAVPDDHLPARQAHPDLEEHRRRSPAA